ncbi:hypothetical protein SDC9_134745 [bioreactor metagenome]|uniref:Uncharacterized protein n=1 Tax=bioreactor metagenome TaxID=1076179 RepID=A0A645DEK4_9ZZZZ|nr:hypothetical protein [Oscillibacter sp.]
MGSNDTIIEEIIRSYPMLAEKMQSLRYSICSSHSKDPTVSAASVELPAEEQRRYDAIRSAVRHTVQAYDDGSRRLLVIRSTYWNITFGANALKEISALEAQEYLQDFVQAVSQRLGMNNCTGCVYWRKLFGSQRSTYACHYCYETGRTRSHDEFQCYSKCLSMENRKNGVPDQSQVRAHEVLA